MVVLQTIFILILVYYGMKLLAKWLLPKVLSYAVNKTQERFGQQFGNYREPENEKNKEGDTTIFKKPNLRSNPSKKVGEYIDFEEID